MQDHQYLAVSGFLFLRFLVPAILSPKLFALRDHHADAKTSRTLTLLAKAIQSMGNLGLQIGSGKEQWMEPLHPLIIESVQQIKKFIDEVVDVEMNNGGESTYVSMSVLASSLSCRVLRDGPAAQRLPPVH